MADPWEVKLDRADEHLVELRRSIQELMVSGAFTAVTDSMGRERAVRLVLTGEIPPRLGAIVGDIIHNARSSLDTVAVAVCEFGNGGKLSEDDERSVQFPITDSPASFDTAIGRRLPHAKDEHIEFICTQQPWYLVNQASVLDDEQRNESILHDDLSTLQRLSNTDKHRRIHLTAWYPSDIYAGSNETVTVGWRQNHPGRPWQHGDVIGWWILDGPDADVEELWPHAEIGLSLQYHLDLNWPGLPVDQFLEGLLRYVRGWVVTPLARMIDGV